MKEDLTPETTLYYYILNEIFGRLPKIVMRMVNQERIAHRITKAAQIYHEAKQKEQQKCQEDL